VNVAANPAVRIKSTQRLRAVAGAGPAGGRIGILTFHSGEDRLVKQAFRAGLRDGTYDKIAEDVIRPTAQEIASNPRSRPTKFRWARKPGA
jgi:16S rRNA C1402 N4-methylase RsmH